ncbi:MAG TPA: type III polyketide synthase, partial [Mycobacterium sp.]
MPAFRPPAIAATTVALPSYRYSQDEATTALAAFAGEEFRRFAATSGVATRRLALPLSRYPELSGFTEANHVYLDVALELGERALRSALDAAAIEPAEVDIVFSTTVTGLAVPTLEARLAARIGLRPDVKRVPLFGLGCVAGAAGVARMHDYLRAFPGHVAALLAVELCSLTIQRDDRSVANLVASSLFGDGAGAVIATGADRTPVGPTVLATRSHIYPDTEDVMGWEIGSDGFRII